MFRKRPQYDRSAKSWIAIVLALVLCIGVCLLWIIRDDEKYLSVLLTGVHHMGNKYDVADFYVSGYSGGNVGREGGGGSDVCCVRLPFRWRPGLFVDLRWEVDRWGDDPADKHEPEYQLYRASVPIEKYESPEHLYVHFYAGGKARIVSSIVGPGHPDHPADADLSSFEQATRGAAVDELFSKKELDNKDRIIDNRQRWQ